MSAVFQNGEERLKRCSLLLVEDDDATRDSFSLIIRKYVKAVYQAENGAIGLERFRENNPDIIITDISMPEMSGPEMIEEIRKINPKVPIIVITAFEDEIHRVSQAQKVLVKPVRKKDYLQALSELAP